MLSFFALGCHEKGKQQQSLAAKQKDINIWSDTETPDAFIYKARRRVFVKN